MKTQAAASSQTAEIKMFTALLKEADLELVTVAKTKPKDTAFGIVFEGPTKAEQAKLNKEPSTPFQDGAGRPRYIVTRLCWCDTKATTDCRFHSTTEEGWKVCPDKPLQYDKEGYEGKEPRKLWIVNPDFGKPKEKVETKESTAVAVA